MAKLSPESAWEFADAIKAIVKPQSNRRKATVQNVDKDGTIWVSLPGSSTVTPIQSTGVNVSPGDTVLTELRGTSLHITENQTNPAIGENTARSIAKQETAHAEAMAKQAKTIADEAQAVAQATNQHFFADDNGAHITDVTQDEWAQAVEDEFSDYDPTTKPYHNQLLNSLGILLRTALNNLVSITRSAIAFYDGAGNAASNIVARFGSDGAQIGKTDAAHSVIDANGQRFYGGTNGATLLANIGYGEGAAASGTANAPYYTFGTRDANAAIGNYSVAEGREVEASGYNSHAEGHWTHATEVYCHAEGLQTTASRPKAHAEGSYTTASGDASHAEGWHTTASTTYAHAEGYYSTASGVDSHAEGSYTTASSLSSHAEGSGSTASGVDSHAEGSGSTASGRSSHAQNHHTYANGDYQTAIGQFNEIDNNNEYALIIGNGDYAAGTRSNATAITWLGEYIAQGWAGVIQMFGGSTPPAGWLLCDGSAVSRTTYAVLFAAIGTTWGAGDGSTTFNLPDLRGRAPIGAGKGSGLTARTLGDSVGVETHAHGGKTGSTTLNANQSGLPAHTHSFTQPTISLKYDKDAGSGTARNRVQENGSDSSTRIATASGGAVGAVTGGAKAATSGHDHTISTNSLIQPSAVVNFIIHTGKTS